MYFSKEYVLIHIRLQMYFRSLSHKCDYTGSHVFNFNAT